MTDFEPTIEEVRLELKDKLKEIREKIKEKHHEWRLNKLSGYYLDDSFDYILNGIFEEYLK